MLVDYFKRYWQGEPVTGDGITHAVGVDQLDDEPIAACGRMVREEDDFHVSQEAPVTCVRCWWRCFVYPSLITWS